MEFRGYVRENGQVGSRNVVAVIPTVFCVSEIVESITDLTRSAQGLMHHQGCCQLPPDLDRVTESLIGLGAHPNVGAALIVSLGCEGVDAETVAQAVALTGKPVELIRMQELGGTSRTIQAGMDIVQRMACSISAQQRELVDLRHYVMGIKCGASDSTSGLASNAVIGYVADRVVEQGGTVMFGETTEFLGAEHVLARRARTPQVAARIYEIVADTEKRARSLGVDMRRGQPTPGNIQGGLSSIEEKSLGAIVKSGTKPIEGVLGYTERPPGPGLWIKDTPGREMEILTGMGVGGCQAMLFSTGRGAPQGFPTFPVIKICGNPQTYRHMCRDMDINAGTIISGERSVEQVGEETLTYLLRVLSGEVTKGEAIKYNRTIDIHTLGPVI